LHNLERDRSADEQFWRKEDEAWSNYDMRLREGKQGAQGAQGQARGQGGLGKPDRLSVGGAEELDDQLAVPAGGLQLSPVKSRAQVEEKEGEGDFHQSFDFEASEENMEVSLGNIHHKHRYHQQRHPSSDNGEGAWWAKKKKEKESDAILMLKQIQLLEPYEAVFREHSVTLEDIRWASVREIEVHHDHKRILCGPCLMAGDIGLYSLLSVT